MCGQKILNWLKPTHYTKLNTLSHKPHLTAIGRKTLPKPTRWLINNGFIVGDVMDYGCGRCANINPPGWFNYDPHYQPNMISGARYDTIVCNYVLCVLPPEERLNVIKHIQVLLRLNGVAYISVRNDKPRCGWGLTKRGTYQGRVGKLSLPLLYQCAGFRIYKLTKETQI